MQLNDLIKKDEKEAYGQELILDIHDVDPGKITQEMIKKFMIEICKEIKMEREKLHFFGTDAELGKYNQRPKYEGISACQFIYTSSITFHGLEEIHEVHLNIFSCKKFDVKVATSFCHNFWGGKIVNKLDVVRK